MNKQITINERKVGKQKCVEFIFTNKYFIIILLINNGYFSHFLPIKLT